MRNKYIESFENAQIAGKQVPEFRAGDTLRVALRIKEGDKSRVQNFEGICIARRGTGTGETFIVRKIGANSVGVERIFPIYSENIEEITLVRRGRVRRSKLVMFFTRIKNYPPKNNFSLTPFGVKALLFLHGILLFYFYKINRALTSFS